MAIVLIKQYIRVSPLKRFHRNRFFPEIPYYILNLINGPSRGSSKDSLSMISMIYNQMFNLYSTKMLVLA